MLFSVNTPGDLTSHGTSDRAFNVVITTQENGGKTREILTRDSLDRLFPGSYDKITQVLGEAILSRDHTRTSSPVPSQSNRSPSPTPSQSNSTSLASLPSDTDSSIVSLESTASNRSLSRTSSSLSSSKDPFEDSSTINSIQDRILDVLRTRLASETTTVDVRVQYQPVAAKLNEARRKASKQLSSQIEEALPKESQRTSYTVSGKLDKTELENIGFKNNPFQQLEGKPPKEDPTPLHDKKALFSPMIKSMNIFRHENNYPVLELPGKLSINAEGNPESINWQFSVQQMNPPDIDQFISKKGFERAKFILEMKKVYRNFLQAQKDSNRPEAIWHPLGNEILNAIRSKMSSHKYLKTFEDNFSSIERDMILAFLEEYEKTYSNLRLTMCIDRLDLQGQWLEIIAAAKEVGKASNITIAQDQNVLKHLEDKLRENTNNLCLPIFSSPLLIPEQDLDPNHIYYYQNRLISQSVYYHFACFLLNNGFKTERLSPKQIETHLRKLKQQFRDYYETT